MTSPVNETVEPTINSAENSLMKRLRKGAVLMTASALFLGVAGVVQLLQEGLAYLGGVGPYMQVFGGSPYTLGFFEAHGLAVVIAVALARGARAPSPGHHTLAASVHAFLGASNLLFWQAFVAFGMVPAGIVSTTLHAILVSLHAGYIWTGRSPVGSPGAPAAATAPRPQQSQRLLWRHGGVPDYGFRAAASATLVGGIYVHVTHILVGREVFLEHVFTPTLDLLLTVPMTWATLIGLVAWRRAAFRSIAERAGYSLVVAYFVLSSVIHARALLQGSVQYVEAFPTWYSYPVLVVLVGFFLFVRSLQFRAATAVQWRSSPPDSQSSTPVASTSPESSPSAARP